MKMDIVFDAICGKLVLFCGGFVFLWVILMSFLSFWHYTKDITLTLTEGNYISNRAKTTTNYRWMPYSWAIWRTMSITFHPAKYAIIGELSTAQATVHRLLRSPRISHETALNTYYIDLRYNGFRLPNDFGYIDNQWRPFQIPRTIYERNSIQ